MASGTNENVSSNSARSRQRTTRSDRITCDKCGRTYRRSLAELHKKRCNVLHKCDLCQHSFRMMTKLVGHRKAIHGIDLTCDECEKTFQSVSKFAVHVKNHRKDKSHVCDICGFATAGKHTLDNHKLVKHRVGRFPVSCPICQKGFVNNSLLRTHVNRHTGATPHQCHRCGSAYSSTRSLDRHCRKQHPETVGKTFHSCGTCSRVFRSRKKLEAHRADKHPDGRRNVCDVCGKDFSFRESLVRHRRIHTGEKPKECHVCRKRFACASYLQSHMRTHTGEKPYQCQVCWKTFTQRSSLVTHEKSHMKTRDSSGPEMNSGTDKPA